MSRGRVVVVGGGPAGASAAWRLARAGVEVVLLDRARFPRDKPCAEYLSPEASRLLDEMGALQALERAGAAQLAGMLVRAPSGEVIRGDFAADHDFPPFRDRGLALRRTRLDALLLDCARSAGVEVREGARVTGLRTTGDGRVGGVEVRDAGGTTASLAADLVIGADGLRSVVARRLDLARHERLPRRLAVVAHFRGVEGIGDFGEMHVEPDGYCGMADVGAGESNLALVVPATRAREMAGDPTGFLDRWVAGKPHLARRFRRAERLGPALATGPFAARARRPWAPGALLVGDAADYFDPFTGEGIFAALRGGELLLPHALEALDHYARGDARRATGALRHYARSRHRAFAGKWVVERMIAAVVASPLLMNRAARVLARRKEMADLLVGVTGDFVPARAVLRASYLWSLFLGPVGDAPVAAGVDGDAPMGRRAAGTFPG